VPPFAAHEWSLQSTYFVAPCGQLAALAVSVLILTVLIARWRLGKRGAVLGFRVNRHWPGVLAAVAALASIPAFGTVTSFPARITDVCLQLPTGPDEFVTVPATLAAAGSLLAIPLLWLLVAISRSISVRTQHALRRTTMGRILVPTWIFAMLVFAASVPLHHAEERFWIGRERLMEITTEAPGLYRYDWQLTQVARKELLEFLGAL
jgi:hypothetical protein